MVVEVEWGGLVWGGEKMRGAERLAREETQEPSPRQVVGKCPCQPAGLLHRRSGGPVF